MRSAITSCRTLSGATTVVVLLLIALAGGCGNSKAHNQKRVLRGDQALQRNQLEQAASEYAAVLKSDHLNGRAYLGLARVRIREQRWDQAEWALTRALDLIKDWPEVRECYVALSDIYLRNYRKPIYMDATQRMASGLLEKDANSFDGHRIMAEMWAARAEAIGDDSSSAARSLRAKALAEFQAAAPLKPGDDALLRRWAATLIRDQQFDRAKVIYHELNSRPTTDMEVTLGLYRIALMSPNPGSASTYVSQAVTLRHADPNKLLDMAELALAHNRLKDVHLLLASAAQTGEQTDRIVQLCTMTGEAELARQTLQSAIKRHPDKARQYLVQEAELLARCDRERDAAEVAHKCLAQFPDEFRCRAVEAYESSLRGDSDAVDQLNKLTMDHAGYAPLYLYLGSVLQKQGKFEEAKYQFLSGLAGGGNDVSLRLALSKLELATHAPQEALADASRVLTQQPHNFEALDILRQAQR